MAYSSFTFEVAALRDATVIRLYGAFDIAAQNIFDAQILPLFDGKSTVTIDLSCLTFFDPTGLYCLLNARDRSLENGAPLRVRGGSELFDKWVEVAGLFDADDA